MRGVSAIIVIILILMIVVALAAIAYIFFSSMLTSLTETGSSSITHVTETLSSCMKIDGSYQNNLYLRNCGQGVITNNTLNIYIDDVSFSFNMTPSSINYGELATISLPIWGISIGLHSLKIANPKIELIKTVESVLHDSAILAFDFDEGSGNYVFDKTENNIGVATNMNTSGNNMNGTIPSGWTRGIFGNALGFDGGDDIVNISNPQNLNSLTDSFTLEVWKKPYAVNYIGYSRIIWFYNNIIDFSFTGDENGYIGIWLEFNDSSISGWIIGTTPLSLGQWYHVAATFSADTGNVSLYVNGKNDGEFEVGQKDIQTLSNNIDIGNINMLSRSFNGTIDSVRIYNRALTPDETVILKIK